MEKFSVEQIQFQKEKEATYQMDAYNLDEIIWKASMFDAMNKGIIVYRRDTGELVGKYATQLECAYALQITPATINHILNKSAQNKTYRIIYGEYYTFEEWNNESED